MAVINQSTCLHPKVYVEPSICASQVGYKRPTDQQRGTAATSTSQNSKIGIKASSVDPYTFPAPLVLPDDDLALDPKCPAQSLRQWIRLKDRNPVNADKNTIYVAAPPSIGSDVKFMQSWTTPTDLSASKTSDIKPPSTVAVVEYLAAYYHGMNVKIVPQSTFKFVSWDSSKPSSSKSTSKKAPTNITPRYMGLNTPTECVRIRTRASKDRVYTRQLNLDDLLDAAISSLPSDAYALVMLVDHDLYESPEDEFVCGRAYGGCRVAVISSARYHPNLDSKQEVERVHAWPASHCESYVKSLTSSSSQPPKKRARTAEQQLNNEQNSSALHAALVAHKSAPSFHQKTSTSVLNGLWLGRVCRTAAHELGHCFGMDHCVYYACSMQGSASLKEDARQAPYLCPVDLAKMLSATGADPVARYNALLAFCIKHSGIHLFDAYRAWIIKVLKDIEGA